eukprot:TRINITY_DN8983_c0_g1_i1.p1 TRINITY_DN8983_c0_g1~~TRINITY_DN8983_c0_g1_i1.p1  ORF type:complete len:438 (-),score=155.86 TRINITY_DN8983_c0_g1_i1:53-1366(-)
MADASRKVVTYIVIGAGNRGTVYSHFAKENPHLAKIVGIAEPRPFNRNLFLKNFGSEIPPENVFNDWKEAASRPKFADAVVIATPDQLHTEPAIQFANLGYNILVEKPLAIKEEDCIEICKAVKKNNVILAVGHVLRYHPYTQKIKEIIASGLIGEIINIQHLEPVGYWHFAHSYVRGNWKNTSTSTFSLMAKSCHDIDWIRYIMNVPCTKISSFGNLTHFKKEKKPKEARDALRCLDCNIKEQCSYSATKVYLDAVKRGVVGWPVNVIVNSDPSEESVIQALEDGPYGLCVYESENNVCDHQVVNLEFEGGKTASFTMVAFTKEICVRKTRIFGTHGELEGDGASKIKVIDFRGKEELHLFEPAMISMETMMRGHEFADWHLMNNFVEAVSIGSSSKILSGPEETLESHLLVFAAERSRLEGKTIDVSGESQKALF